ncbi:hypothetical protein A8B81_02510 [Sulfitobacter pontiacus]|nr:hypothetical protein A8B81_02510 [Sulfitobacter pontiacus]
MASLEETTLLPIDNNTARFWGRVGYNLEFDLNSDSAAEGAHLTQAMGDNTVLACATLADAFEDLYFFEKAAQTQMLAFSSGKPLAVLSDDIAKATAEGWKSYRGMAQRHFNYFKSAL